MQDKGGSAGTLRNVRTADETKHRALTTQTMEEDLASSSSSESESVNNDGDHDTQVRLEEQVRAWLESSGKKSELQAKLRAELFGAIQTELAFRGDLETVDQGRKTVSRREKLLNWLVSQHLTSNKHWLTNSVFVRYKCIIRTRYTVLRAIQFTFTYCFLFKVRRI